ncbi:MAG TPA: NIPSNAP family protein [Blastocatellia bacterium]|nr:NIPSNAP family protein [Blastocatellia bacterium]
MITCYLRYVIDPAKIEEFEHYAHLWTALIEKFGGTHLGYFLPEKTPDSAAFSFPGFGKEGPDNVAIALFSFPDQAAYDAYRQKAATDPECQAATEYFRETNCFLRYERSFMRQLSRD